MRIWGKEMLAFRKILCKFQNKINPNYCIKEIPYLLDEKRAMARLIAHRTIDGSSNFQVIVFRPDLIEFNAAERLCICLQCQESYGSCNLFSSYQIRSHQLNKVHLRSQLTQSVSSSHDDERRYDSIIPQMYVAVAADDNSLDPMWFIKVLEVDCYGNGKGYGNIIPVGVNFTKGHFMEKSVFSNSKYQTYKLSKKVSSILTLILNRTRKVSSLKWMSMQKF